MNVEKGSKSTDPNNLDEHAAVSDLNNDSVNEDEYPEFSSNGLPGKNNGEMLNAHVEPEMNRNVSIDEKENAFGPATIVGLHLSIKEKQRLIAMNPCQPSELVLK